MPKRILRFGMVGCGDLAFHGYGPALRGRAKLVAACDHTPQKARNLMKLLGPGEAYSSCEEMLKDADLDAVIIASSHQSHPSIAVKVAEAGKHFIVQKPLALKVREADRVVHAVRKNGVKALVEPASQLHYLPSMMKDLLDSGAIGRPLYAVGRAAQGGPMHSERFYMEGGPLFDEGVYPISFLSYLLGPARQVTAMGDISIQERKVAPRRFMVKALMKDSVESAHNVAKGATKSVRPEYEDNTFTLIKFKEAMACVIANYVTDYRWGELSILQSLPYIELYGTKGTMRLHWNRLMVYSVDQKFSQPGGTGWFTYEPIGDHNLLEPLKDNFYWQYYGVSLQHLIDCIAKDEEPIPSVEWGRHTVEIMEKAITSMRSGRALRLDTTFQAGYGRTSK